MTLSSDKNKINYVPDGIQTVFPYDFRVDEATHMKVYVDDIEQPSGWTIDGLGDPAGGNVTFAVAPTGNSLTLLREVPYTQETDYTPYDPFPAQTHENALDKLTMQTQQLSEEQGRNITAPPSDDGQTDYTLPPYDAGKGLMWDPDTQKMKNSEDDLDGITGAAQASADAAAVSASQANTSAVNALNSEAAAKASEDLAQLWAEEEEDVPVQGAEYSAYHWARKSENAANNPNLLNRLVHTEIQVGYTSVTAVHHSGNVVTPDFTLGQYGTMPVTGNVTVNKPAVNNGSGALIYRLNPSSGPWTISRGPQVKLLGELPALESGKQYIMLAFSIGGNDLTIQVLEEQL